jgi:hypothetical protein
MRGFAAHPGARPARIRGALAALGALALLLQLALASLHAAPPLGSPGADGAAEQVVAGAPGELAAHPAQEHPGGCPTCRAASQLRLGLRLPAASGAFAAPAPALRLAAPAAAPAPQPPALDGGFPRAPPVA